jgi:hypothetical protein
LGENREITTRHSHTDLDVFVNCEQLSIARGQLETGSGEASEAKRRRAAKVVTGGNRGGVTRATAVPVQRGPRAVKGAPLHALGLLLLSITVFT